MKKLTKNKYANFYLNAAEKFGIDYKILNEEIGLVRIFNEDNIVDVSSIVLGVNSQISAVLSTNKVKTSILLNEKCIPVPSFKTFKNIDKAVEYAANKLRLKKPIVVKPTNGSLSIGITVNPSSLKHIKLAVSEAFEGNSQIMIEEYIPGRHFRITILDDEIIAITERLASNVNADGKGTLAQLIEEKNAFRNNKRLPKIYLRKKDLEYLKENNIQLHKVYPKDLNIILQLGCDMDIGGERVRIDIESIPHKNYDLFVKAAKTLSLRFAGIDYITPDITTPYTNIKTAINEINSAPDSAVHYLDSYPNENYAAERIIKKLFIPKISDGVDLKALSSKFIAIPNI